MTTLSSFLSGTGLLISLLGCLAGCVLRLRQCRASGCTTQDCVARWRARLVPVDLLRGQWPVRVLVNDVIFWLLFIALVVVLFAPGHAVLIGRGMGLDWPGMAFRWADGPEHLRRWQERRRGLRTRTQGACYHGALVGRANSL